MDHTTTTRLLAALCLHIASFAATAQGTDAPFLRQRPRYHLSVGSDRFYLEATNAEDEDMLEGTGTARYSLMVRPAGNWLVGASYFQYATQGVASRTDSSVYVPPHWEGFIFFAWQVPGRTMLYGDVATIRQRVDGYELFAGATIPSRWPRKRVHVTGSAVTGVRLCAVREEHGYTFNTSAPDRFHPVGGPYDATAAVQGNAWAWLLRLRADLHYTRFVSLFTELSIVQQVSAPDLGSSATHAGETLRVPMHRADLSGASGSFGIALHL